MGGRLTVLTGPSGVGKDTVLRERFARDPALEYRGPYTTRPPRPGAREGAAMWSGDEASRRRVAARRGAAHWAPVSARGGGRTLPRRAHRRAMSVRTLDWHSGSPSAIHRLEQ